MSRESVRELVGSLPRWARSRSAVTIALLLCTVPVVVSLTRAPHFDTTFEAFPTMPPGNAGLSTTAGQALADVVANPGLERSSKGWKGRPGSPARRSTKHAHSGGASLTTVNDLQATLDGRVASTRAVLAGAGRYRVEAWVRVPRVYSGGPPRVEFADFASARLVGRQVADVRVRERWQRISSDYVVRAGDLRGTIILRADPSSPARAQVIYWDDVQVLSDDAGIPALPRVNLVSNPGFEYDRNGWGDPPAFAVRRTDALAHSGSGSLRSSSARRAAHDTNAGYTHVVFPRAGTYRAQAWVRLPPSARADRAAVSLEGFSASKLLAQRLGRSQPRSAWQLVSAVYSISSHDLEGSLVLRYGADLSEQGRADAGPAAPTVAYWDDVSVTAPRPEPPRDAPGAAAALRFALEEPQLRLDVALMTGDDGLYDPVRASVVRSSRKGTVSFIVKVENDAPGDARRLAVPLRTALADAARRAALRRAADTWQRFISTVGMSLVPRQRALLQRRAKVVQRMIGAQAPYTVTPPTAVSGVKPASRAEQQRVRRDRQKVISKLGTDLLPRQRGLVAQRTDDLQRMIGSQTGEFVVLPAGGPAAPTRRVDRVLDALPGPFPARVGPVSAAATGIICALLLLGMLFVMTAARRHTAARGS